MSDFEDTLCEECYNRTQKVGPYCLGYKRYFGNFSPKQKCKYFKKNPAPTHCPKCGKPMEEIYKELTVKFNSKPMFVCRNNGGCQGWFCDTCKEWHPHGTTCAVAMVHDMRKGTWTEEIRMITHVLSNANERMEQK